MDVFVEITRNGCKCLESTGRSELLSPSTHQRVSHYLATAVTTAQRLMHAIVAASRPELPCFRRIADKCIHTGVDEHTLTFRR